MRCCAMMRHVSCGMKFCLAVLTAALLGQVAKWCSKARSLSTCSVDKVEAENV